eukprot:scaffold630744_cov22-Prasinocladus_malaysianus.AAC.1
MGGCCCGPNLGRGDANQEAFAVVGDGSARCEGRPHSNGALDDMPYGSCRPIGPWPFCLAVNLYKR